MRYFECQVIILSFLVTRLNAQDVLESCLFDGLVFTYQRAYSSETHRLNKCTESFVYSRSNNFIELRITDVDVNCDGGENNLILVDADSNTVDYCLNRSDFLFYSGSKWIGIVKKGKVEFSFELRKVEAIPNYGNKFVKLPKTTKAPDVKKLVTTTQEANNLPQKMFTCGESFSAKKSASRIIGGKPADAMAWPWQAYITDGMFTCGASLIADQWLVTAAHCDFDMDMWYAYFGEININKNGDENAATKIKISKFIPHERFKFSNDYDIALLKLSDPVKFSQKISPVCMPNGKVETVGNSGIITGWGIEAENSFYLSPILNEVAIRVLPDYYCSMNTKTSLCAGEVSPSIHDACHGDSGGPFVIKDSITNRFYLAGVTSSGNGCKGRGVYVRVSAFEDWIQDIVENN